MILVKSFYVDTTAGLDVINIVHEVRRAVKEANLQSGYLTVVVPNPGAAVVAMEREGKVEEVKKGLQPFVASEVLRCLLPKSLVMTVENGRLSIEPWQEIFLVDYETSQRRREFRVQLFWEVKEIHGPTKR